jgi:hypothetical protein
MRQGKKLFDSFKRRGEWVELLFMTVASALGFNVARPWGDSGRYDVATEHEGIFHRVQVKSTEMWLGTCYLCQLYAYGQRPSTAKEIDFYAIYVLPVDTWYIFPVRVLAGKRTIALTPHLKGHKYQRYMENWAQLTKPHPQPRKSAKPAKANSTKDHRRKAMSTLTARILKRLEARTR